ncbi:phage tail tape measure protein [Microvirgula aerodenitrificans]|uniref:phage tail tape measure protein n=1 Tax=Microvirgula aerodenitrificans TaxID=57480 RepID=UPI00248E0310|nr:phage tail tape measure protein [Microvirgula aerodenitrificans]
MDIATLGMAIDSSEAASAATDLDRMVQAGARAERSAASVGAAMASAGAKFGTASGQSDGLRQAIEHGSDAMRKQQGELAALIGRIDPVVGALGRLDDMESQLRKHTASGLLPADDFAAYSAKITEMRQRLAGADDQMRVSGMTAKQTAQNLRMLPMQFTDIAVSLAGGQSPFMVMMQQGGQIKDMFGGVGAATRAMGGYIAGLVNPFTIAATAAGVLAFAYKQGSDEGTAFSRALIMSGNAAGATVGQLSSVSAALSGITGSQHDAAAVVAEVAKTGKISADSIGLVSEAALQMEKTTGRAVGDTIAEFVKLADEPTKASAALNEQYGYLSASVYEQIRALEEQGNKVAAANLAEKAYGEAMVGRANQITQNLGAIESAWAGVQRMAKIAWDAMLGIGREKSVQDQVADLDARIAAAKSGSAKGGGRGAALGLNVDGGDVAALERQKAALLLSANAKAEDAKATAKWNETNKAGIAASQRLATTEDSLLTKQQQRAKAIKEYRKDVEALRKSGAGQEYTAAKMAADEARIAEKYKDPKGRSKREKAFADDAGTKALLQYKEQEAVLRAQLLSTEKLSEWQKKLAEFEQQIADIKKKRETGSLTLAQKQILAKEDEQRAQLKINVGLEEEKQKKEALQKLNERALQIQAAIASAQENRQEQYDRELAAIGMGSKDQQRTAGMAQLVTEYRRYQDQLAKKADFGEIDPAEYQKRKDEIQAQLGVELAMYEQHYSDIDAAQARWENGASRAIADYVDSSRNMMGQMNGLFTNAFTGMEDALVNFVKTGKISFADLADSIISDLIRMSARAAISPLANMLGSAIGSWVGNGSLGSANMVDNGQVLGSMFATGGHVTGPGSGTSDSIPAWLSNGEYVINAAAVQRYGKGTFDRLNAQKFATGGHVGPAANDGSGVAPNVKVELVNKSSQPVAATQSDVRFNGKDYVIGIVLEDIQRNGRIGKMMGRR